jgi:hypothetical protein
MHAMLTPRSRLHTCIHTADPECSVAKDDVSKARSAAKTHCTSMDSAPRFDGVCAKGVVWTMRFNERGWVKGGVNTEQ